MNAKRYLVTSALPYANGPIHIGHVAGAYLPADIYVRYLRAQRREVVFICGSDEYGTAITETARKQGRTAIEVADEFHVVIRDGFERLGISFDNFSRTSRQVHTEVTQEFFLKLHAKGLLQEVTTEQLFDPEVGKFLADRQIRGTCLYCGNEDAAGDQCERCGKAIDPLELGTPRSALSGAGLERRATTHWYFPFDQFQPWLQEYLASRQGWRPQVVGFCQGYFTEGLRARPVTRDLDWGIPVPLPGHEGKVLYVWFDAPIGYISSTKEWAERIGQPDKWREYWCDKEGTKLVHFIGKDNTVFHALLFPAWCHAHGDYVIAEDVPANEFLNLEGQKFSTSRNHAVWLHDVLDRWPADVLRYYLTTILPETSDSDWKWADLRDRVNGELNDNLGNFVQRTLKFVASYHGAQVPAAGELTDDDRHLLASTAALPGEVGGAIERYELRQALRALLALGTEANGYFQRQQPWQLRRSDLERCGTVLNTCLQVCRAVAVCAAPFIPESAQKLWASLGEAGRADQAGWEDAGTVALPAGQATASDPQPLFAKVTEEAIDQEIARLMRLEDTAEPGRQKLAELEAAGVPVEHIEVIATERVSDSAEESGSDPLSPRERAGVRAMRSAPSRPGTLTPSLSRRERGPEPGHQTPSHEPEYISYEQFRSVELRTALVVSAEPVEGADKLLKLQLEVGGEARQIVAGLAQRYRPEELVGQTIVIVANLEPRKLRGVESHGMLLAADDGETVSVLTVLRPVKSGAEVR